MSEKQEKTKEYLKIMTLSESAYLQGQLLTHYLIGSIVKIIIYLGIHYYFFDGVFSFVFGGIC